MVLSNVDLEGGACYVTVPFDCPEGYDIDGLERSAFVIRPGPHQRLPDDFVTTESTNLAFFELVKSGSHSLVFERRPAPPAPKPGNRFEAAQAGRNEQLYWNAHEDPVLMAACCNSIDEIRFLVEGVPEGELATDTLIGEDGKHLFAIACSVFDWSGYLLWFRR